MADQLDAIVMSKARKWLDGDYDEATKKQVKYLIDNDKKELTESFYKDRVRYGRPAWHHGRGYEPYEHLHGGHRYAGPCELP